MSSSPSLSTESIPVQEMSIQWLDLPRTRQFLKWKAEKFQTVSLGKIVKAVVNLYNNQHPNARPFEHHPKFSSSDSIYKLKLFTRKIRVKTQLATQVKKRGAETKKLEGSRTGDDFLLFFCAKKTLWGKGREVVALSTGQGWPVVQRCRSIDSPSRIGEKILDPLQITKITRYCLVGATMKETLSHPGPGEFYKTSSLYYLIERIEGVVKMNASLLSTPPFSGTMTSRKISFTSGGLLRIHSPLSLDDYPRILPLFHCYIYGVETYSSQGEAEEADPRFEFLHFLKPASVSKSKLDAKLMQVLFQRDRDGEPLDISFRHKYVDDFSRSHDFQIQPKKGGKYYRLSLSPPTLNEVLEAIENGDEVLSEEKLSVAFQERKMKFFNAKEHTFTESLLVDYLEGEVTYKGKRYFKVRGMWYQLSVDFHALMQEDFRAFLRRTLIKPDHEAQLPHMWRGNSDPNLLKEEAVKAVRGTGTGIRKFMKTLETTQVQFVTAKGEVNQARLVGEVLKVPEVAKNKDAIEKILADKTSSKEDFKNAFGADGDKILAELQKPRSILKVNKNERHVRNPLTYPLRHELREKEGAFAALLEKLCNGRKESEEDYNRTYLYDVTNKGKPFGPRRGYLVFDQITPLNIEMCDLIYYTPTTTYLYHVKESFGQHTRDACSQLLNGARQLRSALSTHQPKSYLELLWERGAKMKGEKGWRALVKKQLKSLGKENFLKIFYNRRVVFVYAYLDKSKKPFHEDSSTPTLLSQADLSNPKAWESLEKSRYLDSRGRLTGEFYESSQETFQLEELKEESLAVYKDLSKFKSASDSTLAKLDLLHLAKELESLNFELNLCEIQKPDPTASSSLASLSPVEEEEYSSDETDSVSSSDEAEETLPGGFVNLGNSCYMNAVLHTFSFLKPIQDRIEAKKTTVGIPQALSQALAKRDRASLIWLRETLFSPANLATFPPIRKHRQHDAHEFLNLVLGQLKWFPMHSYTAVYDKPIRREGVSPCHNLSIALTKGKGFEEMLNSYFKREQIEGYDHPVAQRIRPLPNLLIIHLKRFGNDLMKLQADVTYPKDGKVSLQQRKKDPRTHYEIVGLINHHGSTMEAGHYTADVKTEGKWLHCDDSKITVAEPKNPGKEAYIVFLQKIE